MMLIGWFPNHFDWDIAAVHFLAGEHVLASNVDKFSFPEQLIPTIGGASAQTHIDLRPRMSLNHTSAQDGESLEPWSKLGKWLRKHPCSCWVAVSSSCACICIYVRISLSISLLYGWLHQVILLCCWNQLQTTAERHGKASGKFCSPKGETRHSWGAATMKRHLYIYGQTSVAPCNITTHDSCWAIIKQCQYPHWSKTVLSNSTNEQ